MVAPNCREAVLRAALLYRMMQLYFDRFLISCSTFSFEDPGDREKWAQGAYFSKVLSKAVAFRSPKFKEAIRSVSTCVRGSKRSSFFTSVIALAYASCNNAWADGELNRSVSWAVSTGVAYGSTNSAFASRTLRHFSWIISSVRMPCWMAALIFFTEASTSSGNNSTSLPAASALTSASPGVFPWVTPFIFMASVKQRPSKCNFSRSRSVTICLDKEAGILAES